MPARTLTTCPTAGCHGLWDGQRCTVCDRKPQQHGWHDDRPSRSRRGYGRDWLRLRARKLKQQPLCEDCWAQGVVTAATTVDHVQPFQGPGDPLRLAWGNLRSLCEACHARKSQRDGQRIRYPIGGSHPAPPVERAPFG